MLVEHAGLVMDITCNVCAQSCKTYPYKDTRHAVLESMSCIASWGDGSRKSTHRYTFHVCEKCYDTTIAPLLRIQPSIVRD